VENSSHRLGILVFPVNPENKNFRGLLESFACKTLKLKQVYLLESFGELYLIYYFCKILLDIPQNRLIISEIDEYKRDDWDE
jgi:hypothetical protein